MFWLRNKKIFFSYTLLSGGLDISSGSLLFAKVPVYGFSVSKGFIKSML